MSDEGFRVGLARGMDALACVALRRVVLAERQWFITLPDEFEGSVEEEADRIRTHSGDRGIYLVARQQRNVVGLLTAIAGPVRRLRHAAKLEIMVDPAARGQGVGHALMEACCAWADAHPVVTKLGLTVFSTNDAAITLYRAHGFQQEGRRPREYRMDDGTYRDDILMYRFCPPPEGNPVPEA